MLEFVEDIHAAFGTLIWGAGKYLPWWTFGYPVIWAAIAAVEAWRDFFACGTLRSPIHPQSKAAERCAVLPFAAGRS